MGIRKIRTHNTQVIKKEYMTHLTSECIHTKSICTVHVCTYAQKQTHITLKHTFINSKIAPNGEKLIMVVFKWMRANYAKNTHEGAHARTHIYMSAKVKTQEYIRK